MILLFQYKTHSFDTNKAHLHDEYRHKVINTLFLEHLYYIGLSIQGNNKQRLIAMLKNGIKKGQIDSTLEPEKMATWLLVIADGSMGRNIIDPEFNEGEDHVMLEVMLRKLLTKP